jgi:hypothetical protein
VRTALGALARAAALLLLAACAGGKSYPDSVAPKNLTLRTASSARTALGVHNVDAQCRAQYLGTVALDKPLAEIGIPAERWSYLVFDFSTSSFLAAKRTRITLETLLKPRTGYRYEANVSYRDDIYNVVIREQPPRGAWREVAMRDLASCKN